jgi:hypothetical protein
MMEVDSFSAASEQSRSKDALLRTLLLVSQSICIKYFHFL